MEEVIFGLLNLLSLKEIRLLLIVLLCITPLLVAVFRQVIFGNGDNLHDDKLQCRYFLCRKPQALVMVRRELVKRQAVSETVIWYEKYVPRPGAEEADLPHYDSRSFSKGEYIEHFRCKYCTNEWSFPVRYEWDPYNDQESSVEKTFTEKMFKFELWEMTEAEFVTFCQEVYVLGQFKINKSRSSAYEFLSNKLEWDWHPSTFGGLFKQVGIDETNKTIYELTSFGRKRLRRYLLAMKAYPKNRFQRFEVETRRQWV